MAAGVPGGLLKPAETPSATADSSAATAKPSTVTATTGKTDIAEAAKAAAAEKATSSGGKSITLTEKFYARKSDIYEVTTSKARATTPLLLLD